MGKHLLNWLFVILIFSIGILLIIFIGLNWLTLVKISFIFGEPIEIPVIYLLFLSFFTGIVFACLYFFSSHRLQSLLKQYRQEKKEAHRQKKMAEKEERKKNK